MNIKNKLIDNEIYTNAKDYSKERNKVITYFEIGRLLNELGKHYARIVITVDDIRRFNKKSNQLKKVFQKEPIIVDIFI